MWLMYRRMSPRRHPKEADGLSQVAPFNIIVAGVGGQGNLVCSRALGEAAMESGLSPTIGQTFGASRRGGSVLTHVRLADRMVAPLIPRGHLNLLLGLEPLEGLRAVVQFGSRETVAVMIDRPIDTVDTLTGEREYPDIDELFRRTVRLCHQTYRVEPPLEKLPSVRSLNAYVLGIVAGLEIAPIKMEALEDAVSRIDSGLGHNIKAFDMGVSHARGLQPLGLFS
ncbi:MAG: hypothetical protein DRO73_01710 [Candidatus Thorarchaeota archaeon]|nr:MAG: hypothetical protein DRO73_01710 [Candidatus Thorarchaeota archaeon]